VREGESDVYSEEEGEGSGEGARAFRPAHPATAGTAAAAAVRGLWGGGLSDQ